MDCGIVFGQTQLVLVFIFFIFLCFKSIFKNFYFFCFKLVFFFIFLNYFDALMLKIIFKK